MIYNKETKTKSIFHCYRFADSQENTSKTVILSFLAYLFSPRLSNLPDIITYELPFSYHCHKIHVE